MPERIDNPNNGGWTLVTYLDACGEVVEKEEAVEAVIADYDESGALKSEAWGLVSVT